ncbi:hypothetical protein BDW72DRAFT_181305 [Aspergillus terricola var. indicus]
MMDSMDGRKREPCLGQIFSKALVLYVCSALEILIVVSNLGNGAHHVSQGAVVVRSIWQVPTA